MQVKMRGNKEEKGWYVHVQLQIVPLNFSKILPVYAILFNSSLPSKLKQEFVCIYFVFTTVISKERRTKTVLSSNSANEQYPKHELEYFFRKFLCDKVTLSRDIKSTLCIKRKWQKIWNFSTRAIYYIPNLCYLSQKCGLKWKT